MKNYYLILVLAGGLAGVHAQNGPANTPLAGAGEISGSGLGGGGGGSGGGGLAQSDPTADWLANRPGDVIRSGGGTGEGVEEFAQVKNRAESLIIRSAESSPQNAATLPDDLAIMSHILEKALKEKFNQEPPVAMGIELFSFARGPAVQNLYLDGYGALFLLKVSFPLLAPPPVAHEKESEPEDSAWEEAKRELYAPPGSLFHVPQQIIVNAAEPYDAEKVEQLKDALIEALRNAMHIRGLKPEDWVTVAVAGPGNAKQQISRRLDQKTRTARAAVGNRYGGAAAGLQMNPEMAQRYGLMGFGGYAGAGVSSPGAVATASTMLTLRVKKSDTDAFAKGKMDLKEFKKKVAVAAY